MAAGPGPEATEHLAALVRGWRLAEALDLLERRGDLTYAAALAVLDQLAAAVHPTWPSQAVPG